MGQDGFAGDETEALVRSGIVAVLVFLLVVILVAVPLDEALRLGMLW